MKSCPSPLHLEPDAFAPLADTASAWAALHSYCSAVEALYETLAPKLRGAGHEGAVSRPWNCLCARCWPEMEQRGFLVDAQGAARTSARASPAPSASWSSGSTTPPGLPSTSTPPSSWARCSSRISSCPTARKPRPAGPPTPTYWKSSAGNTPLWRTCWSTGSTAKLKSTYADGLLKVIDADGRIRTSFQMTVTATGRLSSTEPNLQNIPTRTELGSQMRRMFVAAPGNLLVDADYSQIELRLLAHISGDEVMQQAFRSGEDFHTLTASKVFHVPPEEVTHQMRSPGQGRELRHRLWHLPLLPVSGHRRHRGRGQGVYGALLRHLHRRPPVYDGGGGAGPAAGLRRHSLRAGVGRCRS